MAEGKRGAVERITRIERRIQALHLRRAGVSQRDIAAQLKVSLRTIQRDLEAALADLAAEQRQGAEALRTLEAERLDALQVAYWPKAMAGDLPAAQLVLRILERRARLFGLDAQPDVALPANTVIILRWSNGDIIDAHPPAGGVAPAALLEPAADSDPPGALPYRVRWATLGQEPAGGDAQPQDGA